MKNLNTILVATDLSENSRRGLRYACSVAAQENAALLIVHVAREFVAWEYPELFPLGEFAGKPWPRDRILAEATLDLNHFLEPHLEIMRQIPRVTRRVVFGPVAQRIAEVAADQHADLIVMSPRRHYGLSRLFTVGVTASVTRISPCPVLAVPSPLPPRSWRGRWLPERFGWLKPSAANT